MPVLDQSSNLTHILQHISALRELPEPASLKRLIDALRVADNDETQINANFAKLIEILNAHPEYGVGLTTFTLRLLDTYKQITMYTDTGIISDDGFAYSVRRLIGHRFLPLLPEEDSVVELVNYLFDHDNDQEWIALISNKHWDKFIDLLGIDKDGERFVAIAKNGILNALVILSYRISGIGLHPDMMKMYPPMTISAVFTAQNQEAVEFVNHYRKAHDLDSLSDKRPDTETDPAQLLVMLEQCQDIVNTIRKRIYKTGISIHMTNMLLRLEQSIHRMQLLIELITDKNHNRDKSIAELISTLITTAKNRYSFGSLLQSNTRLLSRKITDNASRVGEHYISTDKEGYFKMYKRAAMGGLFIGCMATLKTLSYGLVLAPIGRAFVNSMIYGLGFVSIHVAKGTVATKQPAMTAAAIAATISDGTGKTGKQLNKLAELVVDIMRTQFIAIIGNISIAMPVAFLVAYGWGVYYGTPMIDTKMAAHLLHDLDPLRSLALPHAAVAGVFLFLAGLISGYYDNMAAHNKIGDRLKRHPVLRWLLPAKFLSKVARFTEANLGAIMGNFIFGCFLGSTGTIGYILGLPLDIRHIAFASANFIHGIYFLSPKDLTWAVILYGFLGVLLIGFVNLIVSFSLSLMIALRSREVHFRQWSELVSLIIKHLITNPLNFILPRSQSVKYERIDSEGRVIFDEQSSFKEAQLPHQYVVRRLGRRTKSDVQHTAKTDLSQEQFTPFGTKMEAGERGLDMTSETNAKNPLPKPDKPPQLPKDLE